MVPTSLAQFYTGIAHRCWVSFNEMIVNALLTNVRRTLPVFMKSIFNSSIILNNQHIVLDVLRTISDQNDLALHETAILAWGQIARYVGKSGISSGSRSLSRMSTGDEMNLILLKLVEYLGHTNALISGLAYDEVGGLLYASRPR